MRDLGEHSAVGSFVDQTLHSFSCRIAWQRPRLFRYRFLEELKRPHHLKADVFHHLIRSCVADLASKTIRVDDQCLALVGRAVSRRQARVVGEERTHATGVSLLRHDRFDYVLSFSCGLFGCFDFFLEALQLTFVTSANTCRLGLAARPPLLRLLRTRSAFLGQTRVCGEVSLSFF